MFDVIVSGVASWSRGRTVGVRVEIKVDEKKRLTEDELEYWKKQKHPDNLIKATYTGDVLLWFGAI